jgi:hypothetical protein|tara:strand:- start:71 stop:382 length:312 start_codon:yes stop_codon:yes gene_type:complete
MAITERRIMRVNIDKWDDILALEREFQSLECELGITSKKRWLRTMAGPLGISNLIWERDWESVDESEQAYARMSEMPQMSDLWEKLKLCLTDMHNEYYQIVEV